MHPQPIRDAHKKRPFKPFVIHTASGESYPVDHPERMAQTAGGNTALVAHGVESVAMIDVASIAEITYDGRKTAEVDH